ncbi:Glycogen synthase [bacterium HR10]|nr:Glycogen synthase [bacterium HR10]
MRVLLNVTAGELHGPGGDLALYRNWMRLSDERLRFHLLPSSWRRRAQAVVRKACEKLARTWEPARVRQMLHVAARALVLPRRAARGMDLILSHICFPLPQPPVPVIWSSQGIAPPPYYERGGRWTLEDVVFLYRFFGPRADALLIATESGARSLLRWCPELEAKVHVVPVPVIAPSRDVEWKPSQTDGIIRLLFVGLDPSLKGLPELLRAYEQVRRKHPHLRLEVVTRASEDWKKQDSSLLAQGIRVHPPLPHERVLALMREADLFVLPTHADTYALSAVEAMAHRCALIVSNFDPLPELFPDAEVGFTVAPGDVRGLIERLDVLITHRALLRQFQENARRRYLAVHDPARVRLKLEEVFHSVRNRRCGRALGASSSGAS